MQPLDTRQYRLIFTHKILINMKKITVLVVLLSIFSSCDFFKKKEEEAPKVPKKDLVLGGDKDENGCLASAGYTWSKLNKECVRAFSGIQLMPTEPTDDATLCAYLLFDESGNKSELFLPNVEGSIILERDGKNKPWVYGDWQLIALNGYQLKKAGKLVYSGDGEIGNKVTGTNDTEELPIEE